MQDDVIKRVVTTYHRMSMGTAAVTDYARDRLTTYVRMLLDGGQNDPDRLTVLGLAYLKELDGSNDPVRNGYTGM